ncbi:MAG: c-type cytochrome [Betaproteobacteria bacterium]|nr:c-type cytochrome [Betaproteobacteria bacterium]
MKLLSLTVLLALLPMGSALADAVDAAKSPQGYGSKAYVWNRMNPEQIDVLRKSGDAARGREAFRACSGCHKPDGFGLIDGTYPKLAGQHAAVIVKQVTDVRAGIRANPKMAPFASRHAVNTQEIADIAVFLAAQRTARENGKGPGERLSRGEELYKKGCTTCHGERGQGSEARIYPAVAAQHYGYLLRELEHIKGGTRGNAHPRMVRALRGYSAGDLAAVADYLSRMPGGEPTPVVQAGETVNDFPVVARLP